MEGSMPQNAENISPAELTAFFNEHGIDNKELLSAVIEELQTFCQNNILALLPLQENARVQEHIGCFTTISDILAGVDKLVKADVVFKMREKKKKKKKAAKKKHK